jgi:hypothetical protein
LFQFATRVVNRSAELAVENTSEPSLIALRSERWHKIRIAGRSAPEFLARCAPPHFLLLIGTGVAIA